MKIPDYVTNRLPPGADYPLVMEDVVWLVKTLARWTSADNMSNEVRTYIDEHQDEVNEIIKGIDITKRRLRDDNA